MAAKWKSFSKEQIQDLIKESSSGAMFGEKLGYTRNGGGSARAIKSIKELYPDIEFKFSTWKERSKLTTKVNRIESNKTMFIKNSKTDNRTLKKRIIKDDLIAYECECGIKGVWMDKEIVLHLDHINGINNDSRIENLRFLCPNCHSQTDTYCGKNNKKA